MTRQHRVKMFSSSTCSEAEKLLAAALLIAGAVFCGLGSANAKQDAAQTRTLQSAPQTAAPAPAPTDAAEQQLTLPVGTVIQVRIADEINSSHDYPGELLTGIVDPSVLVDNHVVIPRGTEAHMRVTLDKKGHALGGKAKERVELVALVLDQQKLSLDSSDYSRTQKPLQAKVKDATRAGAGSATAASGAYPEAGGVSPIIAAFTAARVDVHAGTRIPFTLQDPFTFDEPRAQSANTPPTGSAIPAPDGSAAAR